MSNAWTACNPADRLRWASLSLSLSLSLSFVTARSLDPKEPSKGRPPSRTSTRFSITKSNQSEPVPLPSSSALLHRFADYPALLLYSPSVTRWSSLRGTTTRGRQTHSTSLPANLKTRMTCSRMRGMRRSKNSPVQMGRRLGTAACVVCRS